MLGLVSLKFGLVLLRLDMIQWLLLLLVLLRERRIWLRCVLVHVRDGYLIHVII